MRKLIPLLVAWAAVAGAQESLVDDAGNAAQPAPLYTVEVIVFAYTENVSIGSEIFVPDLPPRTMRFDESGNPLSPQDSVPEYGDTVIGDTAETATREQDRQAWNVVPRLDAVARSASSGGRGSTAYQLVLLEEDDYQLGKIISQFRRLDVYETLMHFGWTQPAFPEELTPPIELRLFGTPPPGLAGTLTLYLSRYLHLVVDVALDAPQEFEEEVVDDEAFYSFGDDRDDRFSRPVMPVRFRIQEDRILKNGELRYFDHPKFGILAQVTRVENPDDSDSVAAIP
jgi:hypothetical protein